MEFDNEFGIIIKMVNAFISGEDRSLVMAGNIEVTLDKLFPEDDEIQDFVTCFAMYKPGGGELLFDEISLTSESKLLLEYLQTKYNSLSNP